MGGGVIQRVGPLLGTRLTNFGLILGCLVAALLLRFSTLHAPASFDMSVYATIGERMGHGSIPYEDLFDHKQPLIYAIYWLINLVAPHSRVALRISAAVAAGLLAFLIVRLMAARIGISRAALASALLSVIGVTKFVNGIDLNADHVLALLSGAAVLVPFCLGESEWRGLSFVSGLLLGLAVLSKANGALFAVPAVAALIMAGDRSRTTIMRTIGNYAAGAALPIVATAVIFLALDAWSEFVYANVTFNRKYLTTASGTEGFGWAVWDQLGYLFLIAMGWALLRLTIARFKDETTWILSLWLGVAIVVAKISSRPLGHYYAPAIAPAAILIALPLVESARRFRNSLGWLTFAVAVVVMVPFVRNIVATDAPEPGIGAGVYNQWNAVQEQAGNWVGEEASAEDSLFVIWDLPNVYWASGIEPATRYLYVSSVLAVDPGVQDEILADLQSEPPRWVVSSRTHEEPYAAFLSQHDYRTVQTFGSESVGFLDVYELGN